MGSVPLHTYAQVTRVSINAFLRKESSASVSCPPMGPARARTGPVDKGRPPDCGSHGDGLGCPRPTKVQGS